MIINSLANIIIHAKYLNRWAVFCIDLFFSLFSTFISLSFVCTIVEITFSEHLFLKVMVASLGCSIFSFFSCQTYKGVIRYSSFAETGRIALASIMKVVMEVLIILWLIPGLFFRDIFIGGAIDLFLTFSILTIVRTLIIIVYSRLIGGIAINQGRILVYGNENSIGTMQKAFFYDKSGTYQIVGYLRTGTHKSLRIGGRPVYFVNNPMDFNGLMKRKDITAILFTDYHLVKEESERLIRYCEKKKIRMLVLPSIDEVKNGVVNLRNLPEVHIEDLLGRDEISINMMEIAHSLKGKVVLVTGAAGSIGSELCRQLCTFNLKQLVLFDSAETPMHNIRLELEEKYPDMKFSPIIGDVRMSARVENLFKRFHPQVVFHAAAYKHVPLMEENPCEAVHTNVLGTRTVADLSVKYDVEKFVMISTDKAVNPTNVMGASKRLAEIYVQSLSIAISRSLHPGKTRFITTRFGNVLGSNGSVIPRFREQLAKGGPLTVTHPDIIRYFMTIPEACRLVLEAAVMGEGDEIFVFDMGVPVKIADLARRMIELAGLVPDKDVKIEYTGLRPGEKLYEELLASKENILPTSNQKIYRAQVREYEQSQVATAIDELVKLAILVDKSTMVRRMKEIVPEFKSKNSVYEALDKK